VNAGTGPGAARCPECGQRLPEGSLFCPGCGAELPGYAERFLRRSPPPLPTFYERIPLQGRAAARMLVAILAALFAILPLAWAARVEEGGRLVLLADLLLVVAVTTCAMPERRLLRPLLAWPAWRFWLLGGAGALALVLLARLWLFLLGGLGLPVAEGGADLFGELSLPLRLLSICLVPGIFEELAFRGVVLGVLLTMLPRRRAHLLTAFLFAAVHFSPVILPYHFLVGLFLGWLRERSGSLWPAMAAHAVHNALVMMGL